MGRIQSGVGLVTGVPIADTVDKLIALSAQPRDLLTSATDDLKKQQLAVTDLTALVIGVQLAARRLGSETLFSQRSVTSSSDLIATRVTGTPAVGTYQFTPLRTAQTQQLLSNGVADPDAPLGAGDLKLRFGGFLDRSLSLDQLNGGQGIERGKIRITDRSGASAVIDLRAAQTIDDVIQAINQNETLNVRAETDGDSLRIIDGTGQTVSNLRVQEVNGGHTAESLGLAGIDVADSQASGTDIVRLYDGLVLTRLNDGNGVSFAQGGADLRITLGDGTSLDVNLPTSGNQPPTLGDVLKAINAADPARLRASIGSDGDRLVLEDLSGGSGAFTVQSLLGSHAAEDLGLTVAAQAGTITGQRLVSGLKSALLSSLNGGEGLGALGVLQLTDRNGASASVDLSGLETIDDVVGAINASGLALEARLNTARDGLEIVSLSSTPSGNLIVSSGDATGSAEKLGIAANDAVDAIDSGSLRLQVYNENVLLSSLNGGRGVQAGSFVITDSHGAKASVNLGVLQPKTVGDVIQAINALNVGVEARINQAGDGLLLVDTAGGSGKLSVSDSGSGTAAADLRIAGTSTSIDLNGTPTQAIDGSTTLQVDVGAADSLNDLVEKINAANIGVTASVFHDGSGDAPYRLALVSNVPGRAGELLVDGSGLNLDFQELAPAQDALLLVGSLDASGAGVLVSSPTNTFDKVIDGVELTLQGASTSPVIIRVDQTSDSAVSAVKLFVDQFNKLQDKLAEDTAFNATDNTTGILFGSFETLRVESDLARVLSGRFLGTGTIASLGQIGLSLDDQGKLQLDSDKLQSAYNADPQAFQKFFTDEEHGFSKRVDDIVNSLAGEDNSLLINRQLALQAKIDTNNERIALLNDRLDSQRQRLLLEFYNLETTVSKLQGSLSVISNISPLSGVTSNSQKN